MKVSLSLMCMNLTTVAEHIKKLNSFTDNYHIDIMDGHYVRNLALSVDFIKDIRPLTNKTIDAHLMEENIADISQYLNLVDMVTVMTVDPGYAGQKFIKEALLTISQLKDYRKQNSLHFEIQIDGSCNAETYSDLKTAGSDILVLGSSGFFGFSQDIDQCIKMAAKYLN